MRRLFAGEPEQLVRHPGYLGLCLQDVGLIAAAHRIVVLGNVEEFVQDVLVFFHETDHFEGEAEIEIGQLDFPRHAIDRFRISMFYRFRVPCRHVLAQAAFSGKGHALGQTDHFHGHVLAIECRRRQRHIDHPCFQHWVVECLGW